MADSFAGSPVHEMLEQARQLAGARRWQDLADFTCSLSEQDAESSPELAYLAADALRRVARLDESLPLALTAARGAARVGDGRLRLRAENLLGMLDYEAGRFSDAQDRFEQLLQRATEAGDDEFAARASNNLGVLASLRGERELALTAYQRALASYQRLGHARGLAQTHYNVAIVYRDLGIPDRAEGNLALALRYSAETESEDVAALVDTERALLLLTLAGDRILAEKLAERALEAMRRIGDPLGAANAIRVLGVAAGVGGQVDLALQRLGEALATVAVHPDPLLRAEIQRDRGKLLLEAGDTPAAAVALRDSVDNFIAIGSPAEAKATRQLLAGISAV